MASNYLNKLRRRRSAYLSLLNGTPSGLGSESATLSNRDNNNKDNNDQDNNNKDNNDREENDREEDTHNHAHIQNSGNSRVRLNVDSDVRADQEQDVEVDSDVRTRQNYSDNDPLNAELLESLIPLLNRIVEDDR
jgi:ABC-type Zn2+ transport system substrate-binding protein/surface adhesin